MKSNLYQQHEATVIVHSYMKHPELSRNRKAEVASTLCPDNTHSLASWAAQFGRLEALDNRNPNATQWRVSTLLRETAEELYPEVFC